MYVRDLTPLQISLAEGRISFMAARQDLSTSEMKSGGDDELSLFDKENLQSNMKTIYYRQFS